MADPILYGWTSARMRAHGFGHAVYIHADGHEVDVDMVTSTPTCEGSAWGDEVCVGVVTRCVRGIDIARWAQGLTLPLGRHGW